MPRFSLRPSPTSAASVPASAAPEERHRPPVGRLLYGTLRGRLALGILAVLMITSFAVWHTRYQGTGWSQNFNVWLMYRRSRGEDLYRPEDALLLHGNRALKEVALTFDDGPHPASRGQILDILKREGDHATFFDVGMNMALHPGLLRRTLADGNEVANHSYNHLTLTQEPADIRHREINDPDIAFYALTGRHLRLLRPPHMRYNAVVTAESKQAGYVMVNYTTASLDFNPAESPDVIAERTLRRTENGSIILLHDYPPTARALPQILETLRARGFQCVTVSEMLAHLPEPIRTEARNQLQRTP